MKQSQHLLDNAVTCAKLAKRSTDRGMKDRFRRMEAAWRSLAREQDWLDGEVSPIDISRFGRPLPWSARPGSWHNPERAVLS
ncbi:hypothetical protein [Bradyrhizobium sp.]|uniref:hypothetical protein n=1 Tax=Bradyrhizobium sp. TaxID=376 RepID=UPI0025C35F14|nr:hypothetical protein [Bradyrhizobium sp.]